MNSKLAGIVAASLSLLAACTDGGSRSQDSGFEPGSSQDASQPVIARAVRLTVETRFRKFDYQNTGEFPGPSPGVYQNVELEMTEYDGETCGTGCGAEQCQCPASFGSSSFYSEQLLNEAFEYDLKGLRLSEDAPEGSYAIRVRYVRDCSLTWREDRGRCMRRSPTTAETVVTTWDSGNAVVARKKLCIDFEQASPQFRTVYKILQTSYAGFAFFDYLKGYEAREIPEEGSCW